MTLFISISISNRMRIVKFRVNVEIDKENKVQWDWKYFKVKLRSLECWFAIDNWETPRSDSSFYIKFKFEYWVMWQAFSQATAVRSSQTEILDSNIGTKSVNAKTKQNDRTTHTNTHSHTHTHCQPNTRNNSGTGLHWKFRVNRTSMNLNGSHHSSLSHPIPHNLSLLLCLFPCAVYHLGNSLSVIFSLSRW